MNELCHGGPGSGRYPKGSGDRPYQHDSRLRDLFQRRKAKSNNGVYVRLKKKAAEVKNNSSVFKKSEEAKARKLEEKQRTKDQVQMGREIGKSISNVSVGIARGATEAVKGATNNAKKNNKNNDNKNNKNKDGKKKSGSFKGVREGADIAISGLKKYNASTHQKARINASEKDISQVSTAELRERTARLNAEKDYYDALARSTSRGQAKMDKLLDATSGTISFVTGASEAGSQLMKLLKAADTY